MLGRLLSSRYRIVRVLGSGGFGHTYITQDTQRPGHPLCVLKHLSFASHNPAILQQARRMFLSEAETLEKLGEHNQIPRLLAYFEEDEEFYLVQEFVEGHPLSDELLPGKKLSEDQVILLLEDVLSVLEFVHAQNVIHRDIKPENLIRRDRDQKLVLIDFGAVKNIEHTIAEATGITEMSLPVYTSGYGASEQCLGKPRFSSDVYALGVIGIQALTGARAVQLPQDSNTCELVWRDLIEVRHDLATVLEKMTKFQFNQRYQTATEALQQLQALENQTKVPLSRFYAIRGASSPQIQDAPSLRQPRRRFLEGASMPLTIATGIGAAVSLAIAAWSITRTFTPTTLPTINLTPIHNQISLGEKILTPGTVPPLKQEAAEQIAAENFKQATTLLEKVRRVDRADPETLIYLNNAQIGQQPSYTIAVVVPLSTQPGSSTEVLQGVAQAQNQVNQSGGINGVRLKVAIATDSSNPEVAKQVAKAFVDNPTILGVVGHGTSDTTLAAAKIYESGELVAISPVSSAVELSGFSPYMFRTMPSDQLPAKQLGNYMVTQLKKRKAVVFFNSASAYSKSLKDEFSKALFYGDKGKVVEEIDLSKPDFNPAASVDRAIQKGAQVMMLAPNNEFFDRALLVISANQNRLPLLAGDALYSSKTLQIGGKAAAGMVLSVPSYQVELSKS
ncbi:MAG: bifunctional serine/threonine-protein kinase/ABC transporter substrate-binding protein, partial [Phormidesmis sp. CAN_BIN44]|nr:bifunctional serine/threonine-protein kinase/ABC transporter substrate-binding protein [Phormidesmis sp. CAN_BIN44]